MKPILWMVLGAVLAVFVPMIYLYGLEFTGFVILCSIMQCGNPF